MSPSFPWFVITEEGRGNTNTYEFESACSALVFFSQRWVACLLVDQDGLEVCASSGHNPFPFVLRRLRAELIALQKAIRSKDTLCRVVVNGLSGHVLDTQFPTSATIGDVKGRIECSWGLPPRMQKMILGTALLEDQDTMGSLISNHDADTPMALHFQMIADSSSIQQDYERIWQKINGERAKPTNLASRKKLTSWLEQADAMEETMTQKGIPVDTSPCRARVLERPSKLAHGCHRKKTTAFSKRPRPFRVTIASPFVF